MEADFNKSVRFAAVLLAGTMLSGVVIATARAQSTELAPITVEGQRGDEDAGNDGGAANGGGAGTGARGPANGIVAERSISGTKTDAALIETPQSITVVTRQQMEAQGAKSVAEALRYEPGVVSETRVGDRFDNVFIRGFGGFGANANYLHFWDGLRLPRGVSYAMPSIDPYLLERVEVLRGPASVLYGQNNLGGMVNLISKRPTEVPFREIMVGIGDPKLLQFGFDVGGPVDSDGKLLYRIIGLGRNADTDVNYTESERRLIAPSFTWRPNADTTLTLYASYDHDPNSFQQNWLPALGTLQANPNGQIPRSFFSGNPFYNGHDREQSAIGYEFEHSFNDVWTVRQNLRYIHVDSDFKALPATGFATGSTCGAGTTANLCLARTSTHYIESFDAAAVDTHAQAKFDTGPLRHTVLAGLDYQWSSADAVYGTGAATYINYLNPVYTPIVEPALTSRTDQSRTQLGLYTQDQMRLENWAFLLGVRHDWAKADSQVTGAVSNHAEPSDQATTWRAGATYLFENGLAPYASYSTSFEPTLGTDYTGSPFVPTTGEQYEIGLKYEPHWFPGMVMVSLFDITQQNVLTSDSSHRSSIYPLCSAAGIYCQMQLGEVNSRGVEVSTKMTPLQGLDVIAAYSYTDIRVAKSPVVTSGIPIEGKVPIGVPDHTASLWVDYTLQAGPMRGLGFGGGVRYVGQSYGDAINSDAMVVPAYTLFDLGVHYDFAEMSPDLKGWKAAVNIANVADKQYVSACASATQCFYGSGRVVMGKLTYRW
ncbi:ferrichrome-iron receptor [Blastochloris viridis]|uniref:Ferrichrome-iron receptor n=1 Tax=Blastochloris viridis TaxID=1079 RepID=A0A182D2B9_BLAVI|nr:ferrichrome-iron receptor [Blastochloris viridis]